MLKIITVPFILLYMLPFNIFAQQSQPEILNNYSVLSMAKKGLGTSIILMKIKHSNGNYDISSDALLFLKQNKISDEIIVAMMEKSEKVDGTTTSVVSVKTNNSSSKLAPNGSLFSQSPTTTNTINKSVSPLATSIIENLNGSGLYFYDEETKTYTLLDPTVVSGTQDKLNAGAYFGFGAASVSKSFIDGTEANLQISNTRKPTFYFYFDNATTSLNNSNNKVGQKPDNYVDRIYGYDNQLNSKAFSPNDFKLIQLDIKKNSRFFKGGKMSMGGSTSRISSGYFETFKYERLSSNLFRIYFPDELDKNGQFCFLYAGNTSNNNLKGLQNDKTEIKVFDFGIMYKKMKNK